MFMPINMVLSTPSMILIDHFRMSPNTIPRHQRTQPVINMQIKNNVKIWDLVFTYTTNIFSCMVREGEINARGYQHQ